MVVELGSVLRNTKFLEMVYGRVPNFDKLYITRISLDYGIGLDMTAIIMSNLIKLPPKWRSGNTISLTLKFSGVSDFELGYQGEMDSIIHKSDIRCEHLSSFNFRAHLSGQFVGRFDFQDARADHFQPAQLEWAYSRPRTVEG